MSKQLMVTLTVQLVGDVAVQRAVAQFLELADAFTEDSTYSNVSVSHVADEDVDDRTLDGERI